VIATRMLMKQVGAGPEQPKEDVLELLEAMPAPGRDVEMDLIRRRHQREFREVLREAFAALKGEQRNLLSLRHVDRLTTTQVARVFQVNQSTISRRLEQVHQEVYEETKRRLKERLRLSSREFESLLEDIRSQFELSLSQLLREDESQSGDAPRESEDEPEDD
ncbi:MAG TPA: RNA polymerase subunit sigma-70, partial [Myxococcaceae bacterium]|nr:RNA polymerase subunit sigma-70 [Myxococcaceae bacterium]